MSWIDQGRQGHGWFGNGTAPRVDSGGEFGARAFAIAHFAADSFAEREALPFSRDRNAEVLRAFASIMAPEAGLAPDAFRLRFFRASFDPVDAWALQRVMRDIAAADTHAGLVRAGQDLAATIEAHGAEGWTRLLGTAVAEFARAAPKPAANDPAGAQNVQYAVPAGPLPLLLPPQAIPGSRENRALTDATIKGIRQLGEAIGGLFESRRTDWEKDLEEDPRRRPPRARLRSSESPEAATQDGETRDKPPPGSLPINETPWSGDHQAIKDGIEANATDSVRISPDGEAWVENPDGTWRNGGHVDSYTGSGKPSGRTGRERDSRPES